MRTLRETSTIVLALFLIALHPGASGGDRGQQTPEGRDAAEYYERTEHHLAWVDAGGQPTADAWAMLARLRAARDEGLDPDDYGAADLEQAATALQESAGPSSVATSAFDVRLTTSVLRYMRHLHLGRVDPRALGFDLDHAAEPHDFPGLLQSATAGGSLQRLLSTLAPPFAQYAWLKQMLPIYRDRDPARARQIELAMERLRWLPDLNGRPFILVNIPMFHVWAWDAEAEGGRPALDMAVITGRARTRTPVFTSRVTEVVVNPFWNVPDSIAANEILPAIRRDPNYLSRNHMEMTTDGGRVRIRQLPGPWNSLGQLKFVFPNVYSVYLHGTPAVELFRRARRDFSHGCIRVEDPVALAEWALAPQGEWDRSRILAAIDAGATRTIPIAEPPRIVVFYMTAAFVPAEGDVRFADDVYGHDARLDAWLAARKGGAQ